MIDGKFNHEKNEGVKEFIIALGIPAEFAEKSESTKSVMEVTKNGDTITIKNIYPTKETSITFTLGKEFDDPMPNGEVLKSVATLNGNTIEIKSKKDGALEGGRKMEFCATGCVVTLHAAMTDKVGKRYFKRA